LPSCVPSPAAIRSFVGPVFSLKHQGLCTLTFKVAFYLYVLLHDFTHAELAVNLRLVFEFVYLPFPKLCLFRLDQDLSVGSRFQL
jgi:hypothetical protein